MCRREVIQGRFISLQDGELGVWVPFLAFTGKLVVDYGSML
jgi:hypothetical protein